MYLHAKLEFDFLTFLTQILIFKVFWRLLEPHTLATRGPSDNIPCSTGCRKSISLDIKLSARGTCNIENRFIWP